MLKSMSSDAGPMCEMIFKQKQNDPLICAFVLLNYKDQQACALCCAFIRYCLSLFAVSLEVLLHAFAVLHVLFHAAL